MRERTLPVKKDKLAALNELHRPTVVARRLGISKQRWNNYVVGINDMPESIIDLLCEKYHLKKNELILAN